MTKKATATTEPQETGTDVMSVQQRIADCLKNMDKTTQAMTGQNISLAKKVFRLPDGQTSQGPLNCIVVDYMNKNSYYKAAYVEGEFSAPDCTAVGREITTMAPHPSIATPINATCDGCEMNEFGSKGRGKACANNVILAVLPEDFTKDSDLYVIKVAPKGLKAWTNYVRTLGAMNVDPIQAVTSFSFVESETYPQLTFKHIGGNDRLEEMNPFLLKADTLLNSVG